MAQLWISNATSGWEACVLGHEGVCLSPYSPAAVAAALTSDTSERSAEEAPPGHARLLLSRTSNEVIWLLIAQFETEIRVNGWPVRLGLRVLRDRDEIRVGRPGNRFFFSVDSPTFVETLGTDELPSPCPRCRQPFAAGARLVRCPKCDAVYHQEDNLPCWTGYEGSTFATCAVCDRPAVLGDHVAWTPASL